LVTGTQSLELTVSNVCGTASDLIDITSLGSAASIDLGPDFGLCESEFPYTLDAGPGANSYSWSTGETAQTIEVMGPISLTVTLSNVCGDSTDDLDITSLGSTPTIDLGDTQGICDADFPITLDAGTGFDSYAWSSGESTQTITVTQAMSIELTVSNACGSATDQLEINSLGGAPTVNLGADLGLCAAAFPYTLDAGPGMSSHTWSTGDLSQSIVVDSPGLYSVSVSNACGAGSDEIEITSLGDVPTIDLGADQQICETLFPISIEAPTGYDSYVWSAGETTESITISGPQLVEVTVGNVCGSTTDAVEISAGLVETQYLDFEICAGTSVEVFGQEYYDEGTSQTFIADEGFDACGVDLTLDITLLAADNDTILVILDDGDEYLFEGELYTDAGVYDIPTQNVLGCDIMTHLILEKLEGEIIVYIPNAFTPDGDGVNDRFGPSIYIGDGQAIDEYVFQVFNPWGLMVYESTDPDITHWGGGTLEDQGEGSYYQADNIFSWKLVYRAVGSTDTQLRTGSVIMLR